MDAIAMQIYAGIKKAYPGNGRYRPEDDARLTDCAGWYLVNVQGTELSCACLKAPLMAACWAWGRTKRVYSFDSNLADSLTAQADPLKEEDTLPLAVLSRLPCTSFYVHAPDIIAKGISGFFVWFEQGVQAKLMRLLFVVSGKRLSFLPGELQVKDSAPLSDCLPAIEQMSYANILAASKGDPAALKLATGAIYADGPCRNTLHNLILRSLQLVLYLAAENADISPQEEMETPVFAVGREVGKRLGATDVSDPDGAGVRPHIRRGHYHRFWTGPRNGPRELVIRWVEPILVGKKSSEELSVSVKKIQ